MKCMNQVNDGRWCQESYETASRDAGRRAKQLRELGYVVTVGSFGSQVTLVGLVRTTLLDIRPGSNEDTLDLPTVEQVEWSR